MFGKRKKQEKIQSISLKTIKHMEEVKEKLEQENHYYSKPYLLKEIKKILSSKKTVSVLLTFDNKKIIIEHIYSNVSLAKIDRYYINTNPFATLDEVLNDTSILGMSLKDNWDKVKIIIMLDEEYNQVL